MADIDIETRLHEIGNRIQFALVKSGRSEGSVVLLGACKQVSYQRILDAVGLGLDHLGENRVQEAESKFDITDLPHGLKSLQLIGTLQSNKVKRAVQMFDVIQSVDSAKLADRIDLVAGEMKKRAKIYLEVNLSGEDTKTGINLLEFDEVIEFIIAKPNLELVGLMTVPPHSVDPENSRPYFQQLRGLRDSIGKHTSIHVDQIGLSMGMTNDFEVAIEEGATLVRLGSAIWGPRE
ncbi:MAG: YggS family pyridoxal phosphate-dependent enzyme [Dehalococcoidia bacterium]|nr:YggS family pyridoxal phosphate-dependent enzyme [Dehalococcoidia bacterium]MQF98722.1 YggS family pyridoxal phosphate-dependent enzyme [SAR202 cluster bacterium]|tara:strand:- start:202 stop:906 length:705 start_codon:yes stop_codon:yes gene_type:complete